MLKINNAVSSSVLGHIAYRLTGRHDRQFYRGSLEYLSCPRAVASSVCGFGAVMEGRVELCRR